MSKKNFTFLIFFLILFTVLYLSINNSIGQKRLNYFKNFLNSDQKEFVKKYFFPHKIDNRNELISQQQEGISQQEVISQQEEVISQQQEVISQQEEVISQLNETIIQQDKTIFKQDETIIEKRSYLAEIELKFKNFSEDFSLKKLEIIKLSNKLSMTKYKFVEGFYAGINKDYPGSGYLDFHLNNLIALSSRGVLGYNSDIDNNLNFKQIKNNIDSFISIEQFKKGLWFSIKDLKVHNNMIFISYTEEVKKDCWNTSVIFSKLNYQNIDFKKLFSSNECIHSENNIDLEFSAHRSGGRIIAIDNQNILLSIGEYKSRYLSQDQTSVNGKIIKINIKNYQYEIVSMGHRNPQGLYYDIENNFILETEHGPMGGDEINIIYNNSFDKDSIPNYGWPIVSAGEHYGGKTEDNKLKYEKYPLFKSHEEYGFIEPLKSFVPSIGISEITKINDYYYVVSSLKDKSLYFFELDNEDNLANLFRLEVFERVRDMIYKNNYLYLFLEDTASLAIIDVSSL